MRVLLAIEEFDYGRRDQGPSYAAQSLRGPLETLGHDVRIFDTLAEEWGGNAAAAGSALVEAVDSFTPDIVLSMLMSDELPLADLRRVSDRTITANWFADDVWRFRTFSRDVAPAFHWALTTSRVALSAYRGIGVKALYVPWGFNPDIFHPTEIAETHDVLFIGQRYGRRAQLIERLRGDGYSVSTRGSGWPEGRADVSELAGLFAASKVNLNFLESSGGYFRAKGLQFRGAGRIDALLGRLIGYPRQLKARPFEITACGAFLLTEVVPELEECFVSGKELGVIPSYRQLRSAVDYWLTHDAERREVAAAGGARAAKDHSYQQRFERLFAAIGLT